MIDFFDSLGNTLNDIIGSHENNTVGWAGKQVYGYAEGGDVSSSSSGDDTTSSTSGMGNLFSALGTAAKQTWGGKQDTSNLGGGFYNSPAYIAYHYSNLGRFFTQAEPGNKYTDRYLTPEPTKPVQSVNPDEFYARWYTKMRQFAQAEETATRGQPQIRTT